MILPTKVPLCFRFLGNSIAVPHAMMPIRVMLTSCGFDELSVSIVIEACWKDRITPANSIVLRSKDFIFVTPHALVRETIVRHCTVDVAEHDVQCCIQGTVRTLTFQEQCTLLHIAESLGIESPESQGLYFRIGTNKVPFNVQIPTLMHQPIRIFCRNNCIIEIRFVKAFAPLPAMISISDDEADCHQDDIDDDALLQAVSLYENTEPNQMQIVPWIVLQAASKTAHTVYWPTDITPSQISLRIGFLLNQPDSRRVIPWYQAKKIDDMTPPIAIADVHSQCRSDTVAVVITCQDHKIHSCQIVPAFTSPINVVLGVISTCRCHLDKWCEC